MSAQAIILSFAELNGTLRLTGRRRLRKVVPGTHPVADYRGKAGSWFEVDDAAGVALYGRRLVHLLSGHHEVFDQQQKPHWLPRLTPASTFEILAPLPAGAASIAVFRSPVGNEGAPAIEAIRVQLKDLAP